MRYKVTFFSYYESGKCKQIANDIDEAIDAAIKSGARISTIKVEEIK